MKYFAIIFSILLLTLIAGCRKAIEPKNLPQQDARLVLNSILYSDSLISANISSSKSILSGKDYKYITTAVCDVYENDTYIGTLTSTGSGNYVSNIIAKTDKNYTIKVAASGFNSVSASSSVPKNVDLTDVEQYDTLNSKYRVSEQQTGQTTFIKIVGGTAKFRFKIADEPGVKNYYSIRPVVFLVDSTGTEAEEVPNTYIMNNLSGINDENSSSGLTLEVSDDNLVNGKDIQVDVSISFNRDIEYGFRYKTVQVYLELYNLSSDYYKYIVTLNNQVNTGSSVFSEPVQVYSNVTNGMGIVAGTNINAVLIYSH